MAVSPPPITTMGLLRKIGYHRWDHGGEGDDTIVIVNFSGTHLKEYRLQLPIAGNWQVRFNSSWKGYGSDFPEVPIAGIHTGEDRSATIELAPYMAIIASRV
jgi:1,4-alpha-glucan branching enzyme